MSARVTPESSIRVQARPSQGERICVVTGASAGIGKAAAARLAHDGGVVVIVCRDRFRGEAAAAEIGARTGSSHPHVMVGDLSSQASVRELAGKLTFTFPRVDVLINNAGVFKARRTLTVDGLETMFATNHLGHFLLTNLLLWSLRAASHARILNITAPSTVRLDFEDLQGEKHFNALRAFGATKMANLLFAFDLARRLEGAGVTVNAVHPGLVRSQLMREAPPPLRWITSIFSAPPDRAAEAIGSVAMDPKFDGQTGRFYHRGKEIRAAAYAYDPEAQQRLWTVSAALAGLNA